MALPSLQVSLARASASLVAPANAASCGAPGRGPARQGRPPSPAVRRAPASRLVDPVGPAAAGTTPAARAPHRSVAARWTSHRTGYRTSQDQPQDQQDQPQAARLLSVNTPALRGQRPSASAWRRRCSTTRRRRARHRQRHHRAAAASCRAPRRAPPPTSPEGVRPAAVRGRRRLPAAASRAASAAASVGSGGGAPSRARSLSDRIMRLGGDSDSDVSVEEIGLDSLSSSAARLGGGARVAVGGTAATLASGGAARAGAAMAHQSRDLDESANCADSFD